MLHLTKKKKECKIVHSTWRAINKIHTTSHPLRWLLQGKKKPKQTQKITNVSERVWKLEPLCTAGGNVKQGNCYGKQHKKPKIELLYYPTIPPHGVYPRVLKAGTQMFAHPYSEQHYSGPPHLPFPFCGFTYPPPPPPWVPGPWCGQIAGHLSSPQERRRQDT